MAYNLRTGMIGNSNLSVDVNMSDLDASNITSGTFDVARIPTLAKSKISTASTWAEGDIPLLDATKIATGILHTDRIPSFDASKIATGILHLDRIPALTTSKIPDLPATKITSGTFDATLIPNLDAAKITTGTLHNDHIPHMNADKISAGTFATARIPALPYLTTETLTMVAFKNVVSVSTDFADFQSRVNAL